VGLLESLTCLLYIDLVNRILIVLRKRELLSHLLPFHLSMLQLLSGFEVVSILLFHRLLVGHSFQGFLCNVLEAH